MTKLRNIIRRRFENLWWKLVSSTEDTDIFFKDFSCKNIVIVIYKENNVNYIFEGNEFLLGDQVKEILESPISVFDCFDEITKDFDEEFDRISKSIEDTKKKVDEGIRRYNEIKNRNYNYNCDLHIQQQYNEQARNTAHMNMQHQQHMQHQQFMNQMMNNVAAMHNMF